MDSDHQRSFSAAVTYASSFHARHAILNFITPDTNVGDDEADGPNDPPDGNPIIPAEEEGFHGFPDRHPSSVLAARPRRDRRPPDRLIQNMS